MVEQQAPTASPQQPVRIGKQRKKVRTFVYWLGSIALLLVAIDFYTQFNYKSVAVSPSSVRPLQVFTISSTTIARYPVEYCYGLSIDTMYAPDGTILPIKGYDQQLPNTSDDRVGAIHTWLNTGVGVLPKNVYDNYSQWNGEGTFFSGFEGCYPQVSKKPWTDIFKKARTKETIQYVVLGGTSAGKYTLDVYGKKLLVTVE